MRDKSIIFVPEWIAQALFRQKKDLSTLLDYSAASSVLSRRDLAALLVLQDFSHYIVGGNDSISHSWTVEYCWLDSIEKKANNTAPSVSIDAFSMMTTAGRYRYIDARDTSATLARDILIMTEDDAFRDDIKGLMFDEAAFDGNRDVEPFTTVDVSPEYSFVIIKPGFYNPTMTRNDGNELYLKTVRAILSLLYVYQPVHDVARSGWYTRYLELLSKRRIAV